MPNLVTILPEMWKSLCKSPLISLRFSCVNLNKFFQHSQKNVQIITFFTNFSSFSHPLFHNQFTTVKPPTFSQFHKPYYNNNYIN